jgi:hypothetical protein
MKLIGRLACVGMAVLGSAAFAACSSDDSTGSPGTGDAGGDGGDCRSLGCGAGDECSTCADIDGNVFWTCIPVGSSCSR